MKTYQIWLIHFSQFFVGGTGLIYLVMKYLLPEPQDPFSLTRHPWQGSVLGLHILFAPVLIFSVALIWDRHILSKIRTRSGRITGWALLGHFFPMVFSGYFIQIAVEPIWTRAWVWIHIMTSILWLLSYIAHLLWISQPWNPKIKL